MNKIMWCLLGLIVVLFITTCSLVYDAAEQIGGIIRGASVVVATPSGRSAIYLERRKK